MVVIMTRIPYPADRYLLELGRLTYAVQYLEGQIYDLAHVPELTMRVGIDEMEGYSMSRLSTEFRSATVAPGPRQAAVHAWVDEMAEQLDKVARARNGILHARPTTVDGKQRLHRRNLRLGEHFTVDEEKLAEVIQIVEEAIMATSSKRVI